MISGGNLFDAIAPAGAAEQLDILLRTPGQLIERIVSHGQASPPGFWYDQDENEWVLVLGGSAGLRFESEAEPRTLKPGDWIDIPAHNPPPRGVDIR